MKEISSQSIQENNLTEREIASFFEDKMRYLPLFPERIANAIKRIVHKHRNGFFQKILSWFIIGLSDGYPKPPDTIAVCHHLRTQLKILPSTILNEPELAVIHFEKWVEFFRNPPREHNLTFEEIDNRLKAAPIETVDDKADGAEEKISEPELIVPVRKSTFVRTFSNRDVDLIDPDPDSICIEDIAHHLSQINRYNGACAFPYSVAQHSLYIASLAPSEFRLLGLLHDAPEAYTGDLVSPLKRLLPHVDLIKAQVLDLVCSNDKMRPVMDGLLAGLSEAILGYRDVESKLARAIATKFNLPYPRPEIIKDIDVSVMAAEMHQVVHWPDLAALLPMKPADVRIFYKPWHQVRDEFITFYYQCVDNAQTAPVFRVEVTDVDHPRNKAEAANF